MLKQASRWGRQTFLFTGLSTIIEGRLESFCVEIETREGVAYTGDSLSRRGPTLFFSG